MPWYKYSPSAGGILEPYVTVHLWHGNRRVKLLALVDSGANSSLIDVSLAEVLGLDRAKAKKGTAGLAGGSESPVLFWPDCPIEIQFENDRFPFKGHFAEFPDDTENLLGREDFFQRYIVQFWDAQHLMNIDASPEFALPGT